MEARIRQLTQLLENAKVGETPADDGVVEPGMLVTVEMFGDEETFLLGNREISRRLRPRGLLARSPPLGAADQRQEGRRGDVLRDPHRQDHRGQDHQGAKPYTG